MEGKKHGKPDPNPGLNALELREGSLFQQDPCLSSEAWDGLPGAGLLHGMQMSNYDKRRKQARALPLKIPGAHCTGGVTVRGDHQAGSQCRHTMGAPELHPLYRERLVRDCSVSCG